MTDTRAITGALNLLQRLIHAEEHPACDCFDGHGMVREYELLAQARKQLEALTAKPPEQQAGVEGVALQKINAIRKDLVGYQGFNFSRHMYPLVAALEEAGYTAPDYEVCKQNAEKVSAEKGKWADRIYRIHGLDSHSQLGQRKDDVGERLPLWQDMEHSPDDGTWIFCSESAKGPHDSTTAPYSCMQANNPNKARYKLFIRAEMFDEPESIQAALRERGEKK